MPLTLNGTTGIAGVDGSASTPAVQGSDTNTGVFYPAADTVGVSTGGSERMRVDSSGNVGIGTSSPQSRLHIDSASTFSPLALGGSTTVSGINFRNSVYTNGYIYYDNGANLTFQTNGAERARFDSGGNLLVGTTDAGGAAGVGHKLIYSATTPAIYTVINTAGSANTYHLYNTNATNNGFRFYVQVNGGIANYSANNSNLSDERLKTDIELSGNYLDKICAIPVRTFKYKDQGDDPEKTLGVIAQEVEMVAPELVNNDGFGETPEDGVPLKTIYQTDLQYALMKAIQELSAKVDAQAAEIAALKANAPA